MHNKVKEQSWNDVILVDEVWMTFINILGISKQYCRYHSFKNRFRILNIINFKFHDLNKLLRFKKIVFSEYAYFFRYYA